MEQIVGITKYQDLFSDLEAIQMDIEQYIELIKANEVKRDFVASVEKLYGKTLTEELKHIVSVVMSDYFISPNHRVLSATEILRTEDFTGVDFTKLGMIPLIDCKDDDYIVYNFSTQKYEMYNIYDEVSFREADSLKEMIQTIE